MNRNELPQIADSKINDICSSERVNNLNFSDLTHFVI